MRSVVLLSGGLDSAVVAALELEQGHEVLPLWFNYGQRHEAQEFYASARVCEALGLRHRHPIRRQITPLRGSSLTGEGDLTGPSVVVPCRNLIFCVLAVQVAVMAEAEQVVIGCNASDHALFPDCRPEFFAALNALLWLQECLVKVVAPFSGMTKTEVVVEGRRLGFPMQLTWSCYAGEEKPCGECLACHERARALWDAA